MSQPISNSPTVVHNGQALSSSSSSRPQIEGRAVALIVAQEDESECSICFENAPPGEPRRKLVCTHEFHALCIDRWLALKPECPLCRREILSLTEKVLYFSVAAGFCIGSAAVIINHLDSPIRGVFKTTCFALSYIFGATGAEEVRLGRLHQPSTKIIIGLSGAFAAAYALI